MFQPDRPKVHTVWIMRHGNRQDFVDPNWYRYAERPFDPGLSSDGIVQAVQTADRLSREPIDHIFASPFLRTVETASAVAEALDAQFKVEPGLSEWLNPEWFSARPETLPLEVLRARFPRLDPDHAPVLEPHYPETASQTLHRAARTARALVEQHDGVMLLVCHGATVMGAARALIPDASEIHSGLCGLTRLCLHENEWRMELCADISHLSERETEVRFH